jgi:3-deoxy-D-manno-octulosonic-acid transferase
MKIFNVTFFLFYRFLIMPIGLSLLFLLVWPFNKKIQQGIQLRKETHFNGQVGDHTIWIHASSGEFEYAKSVVRDIKKEFNETFILVTYFSPSYAKQIASFPGVDFAMPLPLDTRSAVLDFLNKFKPKMLLVAKTDLWPELLFQTCNRKIPTLLYSTTFRPLKGIRFFLKPYYKMLFNFFTNIYAVSEDDAIHLKSTHTDTPIQVLGDTRYDQVLFRKKNTKNLKTQLFDNKSTPALVAGSTWPEDENILLPAIKELLLENRIKLILAPHEPTHEHLSLLTDKIQSLGLSYNVYSKSDQFKNSVLIIDTLGILADLYAYGDFAFVGGSFKNKIHSVMEPLSVGLPIIVGPHHTNNREAMQFKNINISKNLKAVTSVNSSIEFKDALSKLLSLSGLQTQIQESIIKEVETRAEATNQIIAWYRANQNSSDRHERIST